MFTLDASSLKRKLQTLAARLENAVEAGLNDAAETGAVKARTTTIYTPRSPTGLQARTYAETTGKLQRRIIANTFYASWVNFGNGPPGSRIYPVRAKALRFVINGQVFYRKWVRASKPKPFMTQTNEFEKTYLKQAIATSVQNLITRL